MLHNYMKYGQNLRFWDFKEISHHNKKWYAGMITVENVNGESGVAGIIFLAQISQEIMDLVISTYFSLLF